MDFRALETTIDFAEVRQEQFLGRPFLVAPVVLVKQGVLNGGFLPAEEIARSDAGWDGEPVTVNHPKIDGEFVQANRPEVFEVYVIGMLFNTEFAESIEGERGEAWIDVERALTLGDAGRGIIEILVAHLEGEEDAPALEVSTGYWHQAIERPGEFDGQEYRFEQFGLHPDHLAILTDAEGACSVEDGCGTPRVQSAVDELVRPTGDPERLPLSSRARHAGHVLLGTNCECGQQAAEQLGDGEATTEQPMSDPTDIDIEHLAENSAFDAEALAEMNEEALSALAETVEMNQDTGEDETTEEDEGSEPDVDAELDVDHEPDIDAAPEPDTNTNEEFVTRDELEAFLESQHEQEFREELVARITANRDDLDAEDLEQTPVSVLETLAEKAETELAYDPDAGVGVNYAGRGQPADDFSDAIDEIEVGAGGAIATLTADAQRAD